MPKPLFEILQVRANKIARLGGQSGLSRMINEVIG
jgi:hypothetical protein